MAVNRTNSRNFVAASPATVGNAPALGFLNLKLVLKDGQQVALGGLALGNSKISRQLHDLLVSNPEKLNDIKLVAANYTVNNAQEVDLGNLL